MPTRIIDIGNPLAGKPPQLVITDPSMQEACLALSYFWDPATDTYTLNKKTMNGMLCGIDETCLAAAHRDTLALARSLKIPLAWVDALCIIQGDAKDWEQESRTMAEVYGNATLTVVAGRTNDARNSFLVNDYKYPAPCCEVPFHGGRLGSVMVGPKRSSDVGAVETRGWCLQEKKLSRRMVIFGREQLLFCCRKYNYSEDWYSISTPVPFIRTAPLTANNDPSSQRDRLLRQ